MLRLRFFDFLVRIWRLKARWKVISPVPVILNLFLALELVLTFGILNAFYMIPCWRIHTGGSLRGPFGLFFRTAKLRHKMRKTCRIGRFFIKKAIYFFFWGLGAQIASIRLPSILGIPSSTPASLRRSANFSRRSSPLSLNWMARPLNCT